MRSGTEDRATAAMRAIGETVTGAPSLRLPPAAAPRRARPRWPGWRARLTRPGTGAWRLWLAPAAAAVAVVAVAVSLVLARSVSRDSAIPGGSTPAPAGAASLAGVPAYFVALSGAVGWYAYAPATGQAGLSVAGDLVVGSTGTGKRLATVTPPHGFAFNVVTGAADDRTFVVGATALPSAQQSGQANWSETWYRLRISPATASVTQLTRLPVPPVADVTGVSLSPDGTELAVSRQPRSGPVKAARNAGAALTLWSVADGKELRQWSTPKGQVTAGRPSAAFTSAAFDPDALSTSLRWAPDGGELGFAWNGAQVRRLDLDAAASRQRDLVKASTGQFVFGIGDAFARSGMDCDLLGGWSLSRGGQVLTCAGRVTPFSDQPVNVPGGGTERVFTYGPPCPKSAPSHPALIQEQLTGSTGSIAVHLVAQSTACVSATGPGVANLGWISADGSRIIGQLVNPPGGTAQSGLYATGKSTRLPLPEANLAAVAW
jgi:hypothetical protein